MNDYLIKQTQKFNILRFNVGPLGSNLYAIEPIEKEYSSDAVLIDAGGNFGEVTAALSSRKRTVKAVLLTHGHFDHVMAASEFQATGAKIYLSEEDQKLISGDGNLAKYFGIHLNKFSADNGLIGGLLRICGLEIKVIETPGHTAGGRCFLIENSLFTGDTLMKDSFGRCDFITGDKNALIKSVKSLFDMNNDFIVYPGHGEQTSLFYERENNPINNLTEKNVKF